MRLHPLLPTLALLGALTALACDDPPLDGPHVLRVTPDRAQPGQTIRIDGQRFGADGYVALGGRPLTASTWTDTHIDLPLPADLAAGETLLVVFAAGAPSTPYPVEIIGEPGAIDRPHRFPPDFGDGGRPRDGGPPDDGPRDRGPRDRGTDGPPPPDRGAGVLVASFDPDPIGSNTVYLDALDSPPGELRLAVRPLARVRGLALHLAYDRGLLRYVDATPAGTRTYAVAEIGPGRLALGRVYTTDPADEATTVLRFALVGPGEGRVDLPPRRAAIRDARNTPLPGARAVGGGLRIERR